MQSHSKSGGCLIFWKAVHFTKQLVGIFFVKSQSLWSQVQFQPACHWLFLQQYYDLFLYKEHFQLLWTSLTSFFVEHRHRWFRVGSSFWTKLHEGWSFIDRILFFILYLIIGFFIVVFVLIFILVTIWFLILDSSTSSSWFLIFILVMVMRLDKIVSGVLLFFLWIWIQIHLHLLFNLIFVISNIFFNIYF